MRYTASQNECWLCNWYVGLCVCVTHRIPRLLKIIGNQQAPLRILHDCPAELTALEFCKGQEQHNQLITCVSRPKFNSKFYYIWAWWSFTPCEIGYRNQAWLLQATGIPKIPSFLGDTPSCSWPPWSELQGLICEGPALRGDVGLVPFTPFLFLWKSSIRHSYIS